MSRNDEQIAALRAAVAVSPDNIPLRLHLADTLLGMGRFEEAEQELTAALRAQPEDDSIKLRLARAYHRQHKLSHAQVIVEELLTRNPAPAAARVLHARLLLEDGEVDRAVRQYKQALADDPDVADTDLEAHLGIDADELNAEVVDGRLRISEDGPEPEVDARVERPKIRFRDVGGMETVKEEIRVKIILPMEQPELYAAYGKAIGGGILMYGPPGCGKTYLARATAGEVNANFIAVGINDVLDMWIGNSERNLHSVFETARQQRPCVLFFDEVDALGASRTDFKGSAGRHVINQFLSELDGVEQSNDGVLILAATNAPWHLDSAFRRPGRFDRILFVPPPDAPAREAILELLLDKKPTRDVDYAKVAAKTRDFSGADLKAVVDLTIEDKLREAVKRGAPSPIRTSDLLQAVRQVKPSTKEWLASAKNYALYSNQGGVYDDILAYLKLS